MGLFDSEATIEISVRRLEKFIEAEVRLEMIKKELEREDYIMAGHLRSMLGMEEKKEEKKEEKNDDIG